MSNYTGHLGYVRMSVQRTVLYLVPSGPKETKIFSTKTITEYETEQRELAEFVLELANSKEYLCSKFDEGLILEIREKMSVSGGQSYKEIVQLAL